MIFFLKSKNKENENKNFSDINLKTKNILVRNYLM